MGETEGSRKGERESSRQRNAVPSRGTESGGGGAIDPTACPAAGEEAWAGHPRARRPLSGPAAPRRPSPLPAGRLRALPAPGWRASRPGRAPSRPRGGPSSGRKPALQRAHFPKEGEREGGREGKRQNEGRESGEAGPERGRETGRREGEERGGEEVGRARGESGRPGALPSPPVLRFPSRLLPRPGATRRRRRRRRRRLLPPDRVYCPNPKVQFCGPAAASERDDTGVRQVSEGAGARVGSCGRGRCCPPGRPHLPRGPAREARAGRVRGQARGAHARLGARGTRVSPSTFIYGAASAPGDPCPAFVPPKPPGRALLWGPRPQRPGQGHHPTGVPRFRSPVAPGTRRELRGAPLAGCGSDAPTASCPQPGRFLLRGAYGALWDALRGCKGRLLR